LRRRPAATELRFLCVNVAISPISPLLDAASACVALAICSAHHATHGDQRTQQVAERRQSPVKHARRRSSIAS
jgi:hypothetical protein